VYSDSSFIEFPPVVAAGRLYFGTDHGRVVAVETRGGNLIWERQLGHCIAASPALRARTLLVAAMGPPPCNRGLGVLVALDAHTGRLRWRFLTAPIESSPLVVGSLVVVGARNGYVYAVDLRTGDVRWRYKTSAAVKGSAAAADGVVYIGSYDGYVYALLAATGRLRWRAPSLSGARGRFYATPTVAGGHVFIGATDGIFYSFAARSGRVEWSRRLPSFIYASAAIAGGRVYVGSYDHRLYALDASSGRILWSYLARGPVSGAPTVLDGLVYFSSCGSCSRYESDPAARRTYALDARSGRQAWSFADGEYSPVVTDGTQLYLTGYTRVYALEPERRRPSG
jgi:outer membrane protein assembly factor BamB